MNIRTALLASFLAVVATPAPAQMPPAQAWDIGPWVRGRNYSEGMPAHPSPLPGGKLAFDFPLAGQGQIDAMTTRVSSLTGARQITLRYRIDAAPDTRLVADETPGEPATVSLYFQRQGDNWSAKGRYGSYRWYVPGRAVIPLAVGERTITIPLDETWTNVNGVPNNQDFAGFAQALANSSRIGIAFGSASRRSHGVHATGPARFTLLALEID